MSRTSLLLGEEPLSRLQNAHVLVVGVGGVGAYAAEMIVRAGVGRITLLDADVVEETNINRQLVALHSTLARPKVEVLGERLTDINPRLCLHTLCRYLEADDVEALLDARYDFVVDAIDTLAPKTALLAACVRRRVPVISSMGAGAKYDATAVRLADISKSYNCPLAYILRKKLRKEGISKGFDVVFSEELPQKEAIIPVEERNKKSMTGTVSYLPAVFGCVCAQAAIEYLIKKR